MVLNTDSGDNAHAFTRSMGKTEVKRKDPATRMHTTFLAIEDPFFLGAKLFI
jgi:hypothetical protein